MAQLRKNSRAKLYAKYLSDTYGIPNTKALRATIQALLVASPLLLGPMNNYIRVGLLWISTQQAIVRGNIARADVVSNAIFNAISAVEVLLSSTITPFMNLFPIDTIVQELSDDIDIEDSEQRGEEVVAAEEARSSFMTALLNGIPFSLPMPIVIMFEEAGLSVESFVNIRSYNDVLKWLADVKFKLTRATSIYNMYVQKEYELQKQIEDLTYYKLILDVISTNTLA